MKKPKYISISEYEEKIGSSSCIVSSFADRNAEKTADKLIIQMLKAKIIGEIGEEKTA